MSTQIFRVTVLERDGASVEVDVVIDDAHTRYHPAAGDKTFGFMLLHEATWKLGERDCPLARAVPLDASYDVAAQGADPYVERVECLETERWPVSDWQEYNRHDLGSDPSRCARARFRIVATSPQWTEHVVPGSSWASNG